MSESLETGLSTESYRQRLDSLKKEVTDIKSKVPIDSREQKNITFKSEISRLQSLLDSYSKKIKSEDLKITQLNSHIEHCNQRIKAQRKFRADYFANNRETVEKVKNEIKALENNIDKALQTYNEKVAKNRQIRSKIDSVRRERLVFSWNYKELEQELEKKRLQINEVVEKGSRAIKERDHLKHKITEVKQEIQNEKEDFDNQWNELEKMIQYERLSKDFIYETPHTFPEKTCNTLSLQSQLQSRLQTKEKEIQSEENKLKKYQQELKNLKHLTGLGSVEEVIKVYLDSEMQNFSLFNHVTELSSEMEKLDIQISEIKSAVEKLKLKDGFDIKERTEVIGRLKSKVNKLNTTLEECQNNQKSNQQSVQSAVQAVEKLRQKLNIESKELNVEEYVTESNILHYLGLIEKEVDSRVLKNSKASHYVANSDKNNRKFNLETPSMVEKDLPEEEDVSLPLTEDEIKYKALKVLNEETQKRHRKNR